MCRVGLIKGFGKNSAKLLSKLQINGGNLEPELLQIGDFTIVFNRFDVTSNKLSVGVYPLERSRYIIAYNGEVYEYDNHVYNKSSFKSDVHMALHYIERDGIKQFFSNADIQGTFIIYDKRECCFYVIVDQLNTTGGFYSIFEGNLIVAQEYPIINEVLSENDINEKHPIHIIKNGSYLKIDTDTMGIQKIEYRKHYKKLWTASEDSKPLSDIVAGLNSVIKRVVENRIPKTGDFGILLGGGVDSSVIFVHLLNILKDKRSLNRLKVFTLGQLDLPLKEEENDLINTKVLLKAFNAEHLIEIIPVHYDWTETLYRTKILNRSARQIPPNPAQTQIRHTIQMSCVLAHIAFSHPKIKCVFTGDFADEIFAGYYSMHNNISDTKELVSRVSDKLNDLPINDASRVTLSSLHGVVSILKEIVLKNELSKLQSYKIRKLLAHIDEYSVDEIYEVLEKNQLLSDNIIEILSKIKPVEVRTPFSSHYFLNFLSGVNHQYLVGKIDNKNLPKFLLRCAAIEISIPKEIALRKKIPFNEGGTGLRNGEPDLFEEKIALDCFPDKNDLKKKLIKDLQYLVQLGIIQDEQEFNNIFEEKYEVFCFYYCAKKTGLKRLLNNNIFREKMPDSNYPSKGQLYYNNNLQNYCIKT